MSSAGSSKERLPTSVLVGTLVAASLAPLGSTMIAVALPEIGRDIGVDVSRLTPWLVTSYLITSIALQSLGGKVGDLIGHRRALVGGLLLVIVGGLLGFFVREVHVLGAGRMLMAAGGAATVPATMAMLRNGTSADRRARIFGVFGACMGLAAAIGPLVGGELTERFGWRGVFAASVPIAAGAMLLVLAARTAIRPAGRAADRPTFDWPGSLVLAVGLTLTTVALRASGSAVWWIGGSGVALLAVFPFWERRAVSPVVDFSLFRRRAFLGGGTIIGLQNMAMYPLLFQLPVFFDRVRHVGARTVGQALLALTVAMMLGSVAGGRLTEHVGARAQTLGGSLMALAGLWWFTDFASVQVPTDVMPGLLLIGVGVGLTSPPAQAASMDAVAQEQSGMAGGVLSTIRYIGGVAGTTALGVLLVDPDSTASHQRSIGIYAGALVAAAALSALLPGRPTRT